ncbi:MAG: hypothetical protein ACE5GW_01040 [Planctomycetota bacterium]
MGGGVMGGRGRVILPVMETGAGRDRFWVSVHFRCCNVYQRVYFRKESQVAGGRCPHCLRPVRFEIREDGERGRFFSAEIEGP